MSGVDLQNRMDHVVVVMFENRSFDNLLGYLYEPGEVASFEGVAGRNPSMTACLSKLSSPRARK